MRAANAGSGTTVTTVIVSPAGAGRTGSSATATRVGVSGAVTLLVRARGAVFRVEGFLPFAVVDRFFVATAEP